MHPNGPHFYSNQNKINIKDIDDSKSQEVEQKEDSSPLKVQQKSSTNIQEVPRDLEDAIKDYNDKSVDGLNFASDIADIKMIRRFKSAQLDTGYCDNDHIGSAAKLMNVYTDAQEGKRSIMGKKDENKSEVQNSHIIIPFDTVAVGGKNSALSNYKKGHKNCSLWITLINLIFYYFSVLGLILALIIIYLQEKQNNLRGTSEALSYISSNLQSDPIINIYLTQGTCPSGTEMLKFGIWPGIHNGCYALESETLIPALCDYSRNSDESNIYSIETENLYKWKGFSWCLQRARKEIDYRIAVQCPQGFRQCSSSICISNTLSCPITNITISELSSSSNSTLFGTEYLNIFRQLNLPPLINIRTTKGGLPCFNTNEPSNGYNNYPLLESETEECSRFGRDTINSFQVDTDTQGDFLLSNSISNPIFNFSDYIVLLNQTPSALIGTSRIEILNQDACMNIDSDMIRNSGSLSSKLNSVIAVTIAVCLILHFIMGILLLSYLTGRFYLNKSLSDILTYGEALYKGTFMAILSLESISMAILSSYLAIYIVKLKRSANYYDELATNGCFVQNKISDIFLNYGTFITSNISFCLIFATIILGLNVLYLILTCIVLGGVAKRKSHHRIYN